MTNTGGVPTKLFFDAATNLLIREEISAGEKTRIFDYSDYRPLGGVKEAFRVRADFGGGEIYEIEFDQIEHNPKIAANIFNFPNLSGDPLPDIPALLTRRAGK